MEREGGREGGRGREGGMDGEGGREGGREGEGGIRNLNLGVRKPMHADMHDVQKTTVTS